MQKKTLIYFWFLLLFLWKDTRHSMNSGPTLLSIKQAYHGWTYIYPTKKPNCLFVRKPPPPGHGKLTKTKPTKSIIPHVFVLNEYIIRTHIKIRWILSTDSKKMNLTKENILTMYWPDYSVCVIVKDVKEYNQILEYIEEHRSNR